MVSGCHGGAALHGNGLTVLSRARPASLGHTKIALTVEF